MAGQPSPPNEPRLLDLSPSGQTLIPRGFAVFFQVFLVSCPVPRAGCQPTPGGIQRIQNAGKKIAMLGLQLRDEFKGRRLKGTAIELINNNNTGATQIPAADFLRITYPSTDLLKTL
ncbi:MAG: hypothetical protein ACK5MS_00235, partial [Planctomyces sp.]